MKVREYRDKTGMLRQQIIFDNDEEANTFYIETLHKIMRNPKYYLENLNKCIEFQVPWLSYSGKKECKLKKREFAQTHPKMGK